MVIFFSSNEFKKNMYLHPRPIWWRPLSRKRHREASQKHRAEEPPRYPFSSELLTKSHFPKRKQNNVQFPTV